MAGGDKDDGHPRMISWFRVCSEVEGIMVNIRQGVIQLNLNTSIVCICLKRNLQISAFS